MFTVTPLMGPLDNTSFPILYREDTCLPSSCSSSSSSGTNMVHVAFHFLLQQQQQHYRTHRTSTVTPVWQFLTFRVRYVSHLCREHVGSKNGMWHCALSNRAIWCWCLSSNTAI
mmetsp:Transcript_19873/g.21307  ORF Transcript_19873/g.21307 Transcript_19873/m.21307 type:complete len:114 (-) Transcript_19873:868-1209(-)